MKTYCDPPNGWKYGFPKVVPEKVMNDKEAFNMWLVEEGYPLELIVSMGEHFDCSFWQDGE